MSWLTDPLGMEATFNACCRKVTAFYYLWGCPAVQSSPGIVWPAQELITTFELRQGGVSRFSSWEKASTDPLRDSLCFPLFSLWQEITRSGVVGGESVPFGTPRYRTVTQT